MERRLNHDISGNLCQRSRLYELMPNKEYFHSRNLGMVEILLSS
jgi:hypothetical protein